MTKPRKPLAPLPGKRWVMIHVTMPRPEDLDKGMQIATTFEERHGGKPSMYFARYNEDNTIRITVLTAASAKDLKKCFKGLGAHSIRVVDRGGGSWEHCHMYQVAKHVCTKQPHEIQDVVHWLHNMCGYSYAQEATQHIEHSARIMAYLVKRPNEVRRENPANETKKG